MNAWKYKLIFPTDRLQQKIEITDLKVPWSALKHAGLFYVVT